MLCKLIYRNTIRAQGGVAGRGVSEAVLAAVELNVFVSAMDMVHQHLKIKSICFFFSNSTFCVTSFICSFLSTYTSKELPHITFLWWMQLSVFASNEPEPPSSVMSSLLGEVVK